MILPALFAGLLGLNSGLHAQVIKAKPAPKAAPAAEAEAPAEADGQKTPQLFQLNLTDETGEIAVRPVWKPAPGFKIIPSLKVGQLAMMGAFPYAYPILQASPYAVLGVKGVYSGGFEAMGAATAGTLKLNSKKYFSDPSGSAASPANALYKQDSFSQNYGVTSYYGDVGYVAELGEKVKGAFFLAADAFQFNAGSAGNNSIGMMEGNAGTMWMFRDGGNEVSAYGNVRVEAGRTQFFQNTAEDAWHPGSRVGAEYMRDLGSPANRVGLGVETQFYKSDKAVRPYVKWENRKVAVLVGGNIRKSNNPFYPDVTQVGAEIQAEPFKGVAFGLAGYGGQEKYQLADKARPNYSVTANVSISFDTLFGAKVQTRRADDGARKAYAPAASDTMNGRLPASGYSFNFRNALQNSPTFGEFVNKVPITGGTDSILSAVSAFTESLGRRNYNTKESSVKPNLDNIEELYKRARVSYLNGTQDPILVCLGSGEFGAVLAQALGRRAGINIVAMGTTVAVPDENGARGGHAVSLISTPEYGLVFADWGQLTPTYTQNTKEALRIYQALQGIPEVFHEVTDPAGNGSHVGYLFSEEGKAMVRNLTFNADVDRSALSRVFNDDPRGDDVTVQRYKDILRSKFDR